MGAGRMTPATDRETRRHLGPNPAAAQRTDFDRLAQAGAARRGVPSPLNPDQAADVARTLLGRHGAHGVTLIRAALDRLPVEPDALRRAGL